MKYGYLVLGLCVFMTFFVRLNVENHRMTNFSNNELLKNSDTFISKLQIKDDPNISMFSTDVIATEMSIDRRVLVVSKGRTSGFLASVKVGDVIGYRGYIQELDGRDKYFKYQHVIGILTIEKVLNVNSSPNLLEKVSDKFRSRISSGCSRLDLEQRGLCEGILMGERNNIDATTYSDFKKAQLTHLIVASGSNIAFLVGFIKPLLARSSLRTRSMTIALLTIFYCCATRFEPSILRASIMVILPLLALERGYRLSSKLAFIFTICAALLIDPFLIYRVGFWLSLFASGGLIFISPYVKKRIGSELVANTLSATVAVQPVLIIVFGFKLPVLWWASVVGIAVAEPLSSLGMVLVLATSYIARDNIVSIAVSQAFSFGTKVLIVTSKIAASNAGIYIGAGMSAIAIFAYTIRGSDPTFLAKRTRKEAHEREHHIHNRR